MSFFVLVSISFGVITTCTEVIHEMHFKNNLASSVLHKYTPGGHEDLEPPRDYRLAVSDYDEYCVLSNVDENSLQSDEIYQQQSVQNIQHMRGGAAIMSSESVDDNEKSTTASVQYMITNRMRKILQDELGYLQHEVDTMAPEIAAVVIDRGLNRPSNGMPSSWKRKEPSGEKFIAIAKRAISETSLRANAAKEKVVTLLAQHHQKILPAISLMAVFVYRAELAQGGMLGVRVIRALLEKSLGVLSFPVKRFQAFKKRRAPAKLDFRSLEALHRPSWVDSVHLLVLDARTKTHSM